jgi:hypothetical protein
MVFRDGHDGRQSDLPSQRQRRANDAQRLREQPSSSAHGAHRDVSGIDGGCCTGQPLRKAMTHSLRQRRPFGG